MEVRRNVESKTGKVRVAHSLRGFLRGWLLVGRKIYLALKGLWDWSADYSGRFALLVKGIHSAALVIAVYYPVWGFIPLLWLGLSVGVPWCYAVWALLMIQTFGIFLGYAFTNYRP